jgi:hypothetical protein
MFLYGSETGETYPGRSVSRSNFASKTRSKTRSKIEAESGFEIGPKFSFKTGSKPRFDASFNAGNDDGSTIATGSRTELDIGSQTSTRSRIESGPGNVIGSQAGSSAESSDNFVPSIQITDGWQATQNIPAQKVEIKPRQDERLEFELSRKSGGSD